MTDECNRRCFELDETRWAEFQRILERPVRINPRLAK